MRPGARLPTILVLGGARSGKSRFALERAASLGEPRLFVATAEARDAEMALRISRHRAERGLEWETREEPAAVADVLRGRDGGVVLIDCLTLWLANLFGEDPDTDPTAPVDDLLAALRGRRSAVVAVSNEVGLGIVPDNALARAFRDAAGQLNRRVAELADELHLLVAGHPVRIK
jgi:adenosylcobinamide kinase / adenosylcobinamide-phosphate guanylyltransferase